MSTSPSISIIIPAYNEESRVANTLERISAFMRERLMSYEVLVVDDGSQDRTATIVEQHRNIDRNVRLVSQEENRGKGSAVARGMLEANGQWRLFMDADSSVDIEHLDAFMGYARLGCDVVIGSIAMTPQKSDDNGVMRKVLRWFGKRLIRALATPGIYDSQRGFKLFSDAAAEAIFSRLTVERWGFDIEALVVAREHGYQIAEVPVLWNNPAGHTVSLKSYIATLVELVGILLRKWTGAYKPDGVKKTFGELFRFALAGASNTVVDFCVFNALLISFGGAGSILLAFKGLSFSVAVMNSYFWNRYFVFGSPASSLNANFRQFILVSIVSLFINALVFVSMEQVLFVSIAHPVLAANGAAAIAVLASLATNYLGYKFLVFQR
jgi:glycosyltransferase involved in cell wall biosynthesis